MRTATTIAAWMLLSSCSETDTLANLDPHQPYSDANVTVIGGEASAPVATGQLTTDGCLQVTTETCVPVAREGAYCKNSSGPADAVLVNGQTAVVVCYATEAQKGETIVVDTDNDGDVDVPQTENGAVITFDPATNGKPVNGNITIEANDVTLYGNGPDQTVINGNLHIRGNNARVRGLRVKGNLQIESSNNTAAVVLCVVEGNLEVKSNNVLIAETQVFGNFQVDGNNAILAGNGVEGDWDIKGSGHRCERNYAFSDGDMNMSVATSERGSSLACP